MLGALFEFVQQGLTATKEGTFGLRQISETWQLLPMDLRGE
jgi:hypothetical protein